jgi:hypothetical protein
MRRLAAVLLLAAAVPAFAAHSAPSAKQKELIDQLVTLTHLDENVRFLMDAMLERMGTTMNEKSSDEQKKDFDRYRQLVREKIDYRQIVREIYVPLYAKYLTEQELADVVAFYKSPTGQKVVTVLPAIARDAMQIANETMEAKFMALAKQVQEERRQRRPWEQTMADMRQIATAAEAWGVDHDDRYPPSQTWAELRKELEPTYIKELPQKDGWGNELAWVVSEDGKHYRVVSAGADNAFDWDSRRIAVKELSKEVKYSDRLEDDIIFADGAFIQAPRVSQHKD